MRANTILVRWQGGWRWVGTPTGLRIEICQGHAGDGSEVIAKASAELDTYENGQTEITVGIDPAVGDPVPGVAWRVGQEVFVDGTWRVVVALANRVDDPTGKVTTVPQFGVVLDEPEGRIGRTIRSIGGLNGGTSRTARPVITVPQPGVKPSGTYSPPP